MVAYHPWFREGYQRAKSWVQDGTVGSVYLARGIIGHAGPKEHGCSKYFCEWLHDKQRNGGGSFIDEACYALSQMMDFLGPVTEVSGFATQMGWRDYLPADVEDNAVAILRFAGGALGVIDSKWGQIGRMPFGSSYHGTEGTVLMGRNGLCIYPRRMLREDIEGWVDVPSPRSARSTGEGAHFAKHILEDKPFTGAVSAQGARTVQAAIEAFYRSAETGRAEQVDL
jgi:predicted dehydrogenase